MTNRLKSGLIVLGLSIAAVPTIGAARTHYTGKVPASIALDPVPTITRRPPIAPAARLVSRRAAAHKKAAVKKKVVAKRAAVKKHHKLSHRKVAV